jgi:hypothetical protein
MAAVRVLMLLPALLLAIGSLDASAAQGRGKAKGNGPAFCRNGQGHPVHGWQWCEDKGWSRSGGRVRRDTSDRVDRRGTVASRRLSVAADQGYSDGYDKGIEDVDRKREFDPTRHSWYKNADRGYESEYGTRAEYGNAYRDGFRDGYEAGFRARQVNDRNSGDSGSTARRRWPF